MPNPPKLRLAGWILTVTGALIGHAAMIDRSMKFCGRLLVIVCLIGIAGVLATTPTDAIRLRRRTSEAFIAAVSIALAVADPGWIGLGRVVVTGLLLVVLRVWRKSAWWAVMGGWIAV